MKSLAQRQLEHVARAIWLAEYEDAFPEPGTIGHHMAMQMAIAATEALAQAMEMADEALQSKSGVHVEERKF